jgi:hypothetical protein
MLTDVVWRSVSRPLVILRRQRQPPQTAEQWGDPLTFGSRPRPLDQVPQTAILTTSPEAIADGSQSHDGGAAPAAAAEQGETHSAAQPAPAPAPAADEGEETPAKQPVLVPAHAPGAPALAFDSNPSNPSHVQSAAHVDPQREPAPEPVDWAACLREDDTDTPFTVEDFTAARPARSGLCRRSRTTSYMSIGRHFRNYTCFCAPPLLLCSR